jgi:hypothetical protein
MAWYAYYADHAEWAKLAGLFTPEAVFTTYDPKGELYLDLTGPQAIEDTIRTGVGNSRAIHHLFSYTADVHSPTSASLVVNMEDIITPPDGDTSGAAVQFGDVQFRSVHGYGHLAKPSRPFPNRSGRAGSASSLATILRESRSTTT